MPPTLPPPLPAPLPDTVAEYLDRHHVMTLATCGPDGPWAAAVFYVNAGHALFFLSSPSSRHCRNLAQDPRCAATIQEDCSDWAQIKGVQLEGRAGEIHGEEELRARQRYGDKFPIVGRLATAPAAIALALAKVRWYRLDVERLYFVDNSRGFGHRDQIDLVCCPADI
jgi:uncharacterized protein YhbP (UPF0306 family)